MLHHVQSLARGGRVPAAALTTGPQDSSRRWWTNFRKSLVGEAQALGLCRSLWDRGIVAAMVTALVAIGLVLWAGVRFDFEHVDVTPLFVVLAQLKTRKGSVFFGFGAVASSTSCPFNRTKPVTAYSISPDGRDSRTVPVT